MSSSRLIVREEDDGGEESNSKIDTSKNLDGIENDAPKNLRRDGGENEDGTDDKEDKYCVETSVSSTESEKPSLGQAEAGEEDEGFRTPTSLDHRIPVIKECPPAPRKIRPNPSTKRKEISPRICRRLHFDLSSAEVESIFPLKLQEDDTNLKIKKARTEDSE